jgi:hypothetical protein
MERKNIFDTVLAHEPSEICKGEKMPAKLRGDNHSLLLERDFVILFLPARMTRKMMSPLASSIFS